MAALASYERFCLRLVLLGLTCGFVSAAQAAEVLYVQAAQAGLKAEPKGDAAEAAKVVRGEELQVLKKEGLWIQVKATSGEGWISKLFVSPTKPVGAASLVTDVKNEFKSSRERTAPRAVVASTRGLDSSANLERVREGRQLFRTDYGALNLIEGLKVTPEEITNFRNGGNLK